ncbi:hypothetical protein [Streptomyces gibsoniae]|uniref:Uncharacterized protein n=1 Tax=Streptomyces gibsoniae TaxID=3075529 RepID=A0ABU2TNZ1_9ACTN|nr:hypothetical protein [Streptomyces sp. DSM 41699]MDT0462630.1 hypothetical protein [Streptomyces sp. DSM 41699]
MTGRSSAGRRVAASLLGVDRPGRGPAEVAVRRGLPFGRRVLAAVLGVRVGGPADEVAGAPETPAGQSVPAVVPTSEPDRAVPEAGGRPLPGPEVEGSPEPRAPRTAARREPYPRPRAAGAPQHLLSEDRPDYERVLDEALRSAPYRPEPAATGRRLGPEQLRVMALDATPLIAAAAAPEYHHYVHVREETSPGFAAAAGETTEGAGAFALAAVLAPVLAGAAAVIFLLLGYALKLLVPAASPAQALVTAGWYFGALTAAAIVADAIGLLVITRRGGPSGSGPEPAGALPPEVARAREAWRTALLERGVLPFLRAALEEDGRGFTSPGFTSPDHSASAPAPDPARQERASD